MKQIARLVRSRHARDIVATGGSTTALANKSDQGAVLLLVAPDASLRAHLLACTAVAVRTAKLTECQVDQLEGAIITSHAKAVVLGLSDGRLTLDMVRQIRRVAPHTGVVVCADDIGWFEQTFAAGADAWVPCHVTPDAFAHALKSCTRRSPRT